MTGDDRVRFCSECQLTVHNFAELTGTEAEDLLRTTEGRICGRLYRRIDGTVITKDCPVGLRAARQRVAKVATAAFAALLSLASAAAGQKQSDKDKSCKQQVRITSKLDQVPSSTGTVVGTLLDPMGAVIVGADVSIVDRSSDKTYRLRSDDDGRFTQSGLPPANYEVVVDYPGFKRLKVSKLKIAANQISVLEATLLLDGKTETVGILMAEPSLIDTNGTTVISGDLIRRLPH